MCDRDGTEEGMIEERNSISSTQSWRNPPQPQTSSRSIGVSERKSAASGCLLCDDHVSVRPGLVLAHRNNERVAIGSMLSLR